MIGRGFACALLASLLCACNLQRPQITLTLVPVETRAPTAILELPTETPVVFTAPTRAATTTQTPASLPSLTAPATSTQDESESPTRTGIPAPTEPQRENRPPTFTPLPTFDQTEVASWLATSTARPTALVTWTAAPTLPPAILGVGLRAVATADRATATRSPGDSALNASPPATALPRLGAATPTPTPTPTRYQPTVAVRQEWISNPIEPPVLQTSNFNTIGAPAYQYAVNPQQLFTYQDLRLGGGVALFAPNPASVDSFLRTNQAGLLFYRAIGSASEVQMIHSPFFDGFTATDSLANKNRVAEIDWSADGRQFTFRIDPPAGSDNGNAGVWLWQPERVSPTDPTYAVIRDCAASDYISCQLVRPSNAQFWKTVNVQWSPVAGRNDILLTVELPAENRQALALAQPTRDAKYAENAPAFFRYDFGYWNPNGDGIVLSGRRPDGRVVIAQVNNQFGGEQVLFDASAAGLWMQDAVRRPNGQIVALGRPGGAHDNAAVALYNQYGKAISAPIGFAAPNDVQWYPDRSAVAVTVADRQYTVHVDSGAVTDTTDLTRNPSFGAGETGVAPLPSGVIRGSEYYPGQQLRTLQNLNLRQQPSTAAQIIGGLFRGDYVAIIAGPHEAEGYRWWRVQTANDILGWIAGAISGRPTIAPG